MHIAPVSETELAALGVDVGAMKQSLGFVPNSMRIAARRPPLMQAFSELVGAVMGGGEIKPDLRMMVGFMASRAAGCLYCQAHTSHNSHGAGVATEKIQAIWEFEQSKLFNAAERAALRFARDGAQQPNAVTGRHYADLKQFFSEEQIVDLLAIISLFGFLNRWNDSLGTALEEQPLDYAQTNLAGQGWTAGKHADQPPREEIETPVYGSSNAEA